MCDFCCAPVCLCVCRFVCLSICVVFFLCECYLPTWNSHQTCVIHMWYWLWLCLFYDYFSVSILCSRGLSVFLSVYLSFCRCGFCVSDVYVPALNSHQACVSHVCLFNALVVCLLFYCYDFCVNDVYQPGKVVSVSLSLPLSSALLCLLLCLFVFVGCGFCVNDVYQPDIPIKPV